ncbi:MAG: ABATE domain-containing protein [Chloroflexi bacterium]|nr:ABATE domain-containing protein [Chloroflexota bacterium]
MREASVITRQAPEFDFSGGRLCLDFANTLEDRPSDAPRELLNSYQDFVSWGQQAHIVTEEEAQKLLEEAQRRPGEAAQVFEQAVTVREAMYRIFSLVAEDASPAPSDLLILNDVLSKAMAHARLIPEADGFAWGWAVEERALDRVLWPVVRSVADILTSDELHEVRVCAAGDCNWLFLDTSKNQSRRWCNMRSCGNRAKARRHNERKKQSSQAS